ncbi:MAG: TraR/DksA C4-type zinc finger protein [bacterium]
MRKNGFLQKCVILRLCDRTLFEGLIMGITVVNDVLYGRVRDQFRVMSFNQDRHKYSIFHLIALSARKEMSYDMHPENKYCRMCGTEIPKARLEAIPDTLICVTCSEAVGGEFELEVSISGTGKAGSLKKTGQQLHIKRKRKALL